jgi:hypothetical protein
LVYHSNFFLHIPGYSSPNIIRVIKSRRMRMVGHVVCLEKMRNMYKILIGKPEGKRPLGRTRTGFHLLRKGSGGGLMNIVMNASC